MNFFFRSQFTFFLWKTNRKLPKLYFLSDFEAVYLIVRILRTSVSSNFLSHVKKSNNRTFSFCGKNQKTNRTTSPNWIFLPILKYNIWEVFFSSFLSWHYSFHLIKSEDKQCDCNLYSNFVIVIICSFFLSREIYIHIFRQNQMTDSMCDLPKLHLFQTLKHWRIPFFTPQLKFHMKKSKVKQCDNPKTAIYFLLLKHCIWDVEFFFFHSSVPISREKILRQTVRDIP